MATFVCNKVNQSETEDIAAGKLFLQRRYEMIWNDQLWKDSLVEYTQTLSADGYVESSTWLPTKQVLLLPPEFDKVGAVRTDTRKLDIQSSEIFYRIDADSFAANGTNRDYRHLPKAVWEYDTGSETTFGTHLAASGDAGSAYNAEYVSDDGITVLPVPGTLQAADSPITGPASKLNFFNTIAVDSLIYIYSGNGSQLAYTTDGQAPRRCRIQLVGAVSYPCTIRVMGKARASAFSGDTDEPIISGLENCLLAFAQADMLERERQYGKAAAIFQEGQLLLDQLKKQEVVQQAHYQRIIPESGYGDQWPLEMSPLTF